MTIVTRLWHLAGQEVVVVHNGERKPNETVAADGTLDLDYYEGGHTLKVGLYYASKVKTVPIASTNVEAAGVIEQKNVSKVWVRVHNTTSVEAGTTEDNLRPYPPRVNENWGDAPLPKSQLLEIPIDNDWNLDGQVIIMNREPSACVITGLVLEVEG